MSEIDPRVTILLNKPQLKQLTAEWFKARPGLITASSAAALLVRDSGTCDPYIREFDLEDIFDKNGRCCNPYSTKSQYFLDKCQGSKFKGNSATYWGQKYEQVVTDIYSKINNIEVLEFGLIVHDNIDYLAASPDGITTEGVMLEIKCPFRRKITGIPPLYYWIQVQLQLEVCDLDFCDFAEYSFVEFATEEEFNDVETISKTFLHKGLFIQIEKEDENFTCNPADNKYIYPEKELIDQCEALFAWRDATLASLGPLPSNLKVSTVYWKVDENSIVRIKRDRDWFEYVKPIFAKEWNKILYYKKGNNYRHLLSNRGKELSGSILHLDSTEVKCILD